ncbi:MAG: type III secretion system chaperone [Desulfamplus sp.]|nr:type III secretion system chaperone [Desulfamplus sp.]
MHTQDLLKELGLKIGLDDLALDEHNICRLIFDGKITIDMEPDAHGKALFLYTTITACPEENQAPFLAKLLGANAFGRDTGNAFFCLDPDDGDVMLQEKFHLDELTYESFFSRFEAFVERTEDWLSRVEAGELDSRLDAGMAVNGDKSHGEPVSALQMMMGNFIRG